MRFNGPKSLPAPMNDIISSWYPSPLRDQANLSPNSMNKAKDKWHQRGGACLQISPITPSRKVPPERKRGPEMERSTGAGHRSLVRLLSTGIHRTGKLHSVSGHGYPAMHHSSVTRQASPVTVDSLGFTSGHSVSGSVHSRIARSSAPRIESKHSKYRRPQYMRSGFRHKSPTKRGSTAVDKDSLTGPKALRSKRKRAIFRHGLGGLVGKVKSVGEKIREKDRKRRALAKRKQKLKLDRMSESSDDDDAYMQLSTPTTEVQDMATFQVHEEEPRSRFDWKICFSMFLGSWRERRESADSACSLMVGNSAANSQSISKASCIRLYPSIAHDGVSDFESEHNDSDEQALDDDNPFETPLPSATLSVVSMASIDSSGDSFTDMDFLPEGITTPTKSGSVSTYTHDSMFMTTSNSFPNVQLNVNRGKRDKLGRFFGPEVLQHC